MEKLKKKAISLGATDLQPSKRKYKKYVVVYNNKKIHFGDNRYDDYTLHDDNERRKRYRLRASKIKDKDGNYTYKDKTKANYWSYNLLW
jgi:hypothetical protein